jgi:hypothetical protein
MENKNAGCVAPEAIVSLMESGDLQIQLSTVQEETFFDQNIDVLNPGDGCYCNPGQSCC